MDRLHKTSINKILTVIAEILILVDKIRVNSEGEKNSRKGSHHFFQESIEMNLAM